MKLLFCEGVMVFRVRSLKLPLLRALFDDLLWWKLGETIGLHWSPMAGVD